MKLDTSDALLHYTVIGIAVPLQDTILSLYTDNALRVDCVFLQKERLVAAMREVASALESNKQECTVKCTSYRAIAVE